MTANLSSTPSPGEPSPASAPTSFPSGVMVVGQDQVIAHSPELARLFPALQQARPAVAELSPAIQEIVREAQSTGAPVRREIPLNPRGPVVEISALPLAAGAVSRVVLSVAERPAAAPQLDALRRLDRLASLGTLSASTAHEVRNAFVAVKTFIDLLIERDTDTELSGLVRREMRRIDALVGQMLRFASPAHPGRTPVSLHKTIEHTLRMVSPNLKSRSITLKHEPAAQPDLVSGDDYQLEQALLNLLVNAIEAMGTDGTLTVATANLCAGDPAIAGTEFASRDCLRVIIRDTGPGISAETQRRLFEPFFTTKAQGTGLGLAITQRIVKEHGGFILLRSAPGRGCEFQLHFPAPAA